MKKVELLAPAGNWEKLEIAINYGADAVYMSGPDFSLRNYAGNFKSEDLPAAVKYAHSNGKKVYVTCNIYPRNNELSGIRSFLKIVGDSGADGIIISDPGVILDAKEIIPQIPIHLSTQANTTNFRNVQFWEMLGVARINTARELSLEEISEIRRNVGIEIEAFVHGAMCISYSGRCLLSSFMANRDSNRGLCCHPCRWKYSVVEEMRPGFYYPLDEDSRGTYIFNSRDICMIEHIPELIASGLDSLKIEGRMKGINYLAPVVKAYREAIDSYYTNPDGFKIKDEWIKELESVNNRGYSKGFYLNEESDSAPNLSNIKGESDYLLVGKVATDTSNGKTEVFVRNKICVNDKLEILSPSKPTSIDTVSAIVTDKGINTDIVQNGSIASMILQGSYKKNDIVRKKVS
ncbi:peptidase U32 family protein [Desulforegula conservatrix]|uniref:peptidase U32 family protein n=1 Tax=Desulforegula conservatrix TaxID=153026 RepID=UPI000405CD32|nr:U32 family peptidase [Desulforegula conservatrix]